MDIMKSYPIWDAQKNFYEFNQVGKKIFIKKDDKIIFESTLLKLKEVEEYPVRPIIINDKLYVFNYDKGFEIHYLDGSNKKFFNTRAICKIAFAKSRLFLQKQIKLVTFDTLKEEIEDIKPISESVDINPINENYLLFYLLKYNKSYLYNVETKEYLELPKFFAKFGIITKALMQDNKLIIFYYGRELENPRGVYVYDLQKQKGEFSYALSISKNSANCHKYLDLINFSFNDNENIPANLEQDSDYIKYLFLILKKFGFFAFLYYSSNERLEKLEDTSICREIKNAIKVFSEKMSKYPKSNKEFDKIIAEMVLAEERLKAIKT